jgi:prepilin-type N-terminal cleavage/methylation domain-containing protein
MTPDPSRLRAFTLLELLVVIGIMALLLALVAPAVTSIKQADDLTRSSYGIAKILEQARSYAMANSTYVWVGFKEVDVSKDSSLTPQQPGIGRVAVAVIAARDGTRGYDATSTSLPNPAWSNYANGANFIPIGRLQRFENVHLSTVLNGYYYPPPVSGNMARPYIQSNNYVIGNAPSCLTPFDWPLGTAINGGQYSFKKVIYFDPQGIARIQYATNSDEIRDYIEVGLQQTYGTAISTGANVAAIQLDCMTGSVRMYRP